VHNLNHQNMEEDESRQGLRPEEGNIYSWGKYFNVMFSNVLYIKSMQFICI
jgi:hypothetical protein